MPKFIAKSKFDAKKYDGMELSVLHFKQYVMAINYTMLTESHLISDPLFSLLVSYFFTYFPFHTFRKVTRKLTKDVLTFSFKYIIYVILFVCEFILSL